MIPRGAIYNEDAYELGKMIDHSAWQAGEKLVRLITPSDIDVVWDNSGRVLFAELSSKTAIWADIKVGQRRVYEAVIAAGPHCAVLCRHRVTVADMRSIDSKIDIVEFSPMIFDHGVVVLPVQVGNERWQRFVKRWFEDPIKLRRLLLGWSVRQHGGK